MSFLKSFLFFGLVPVALMLGVGIYLEPLRGDLTRVGMVSERSWGWNGTRPVIEQIENVPTPETQVIVIGDSFSMGSLWQSVMQRESGLTFATYHWNSLGDPRCLGRAIPVLLQRHPRARFVVVESVERHFINRFAAPADGGERCRTNIRPAPREVQRVPPRRPLLDFSDGLPDVGYALKALAAEGNPYPRLVATGSAYVAPLTRGDLFSNRRSDRLLFFADDLDEQDWTAEQVAAAIGNLRAFEESARTLGVQPLLLIIPDKLTVYAPYLQEPLPGPPADIWDAMAEGDLPSIPLRAIFEREVTRHVDFYLPDDTHAGTHAFTIMGREVAGFIRAGAGPGAQNLSSGPR